LTNDAASLAGLWTARRASLEIQVVSREVPAGTLDAPEVETARQSLR